MARMTIKDLGYSPGQLPAGPKNSILDVAGKLKRLDSVHSLICSGVRVGQVTVGKDGDDVCRGVTVVLPRDPKELYVPCYAGMHTLNGNGEGIFVTLKLS